MAEWFKAHAWKVCIRLKRIGGSNPPFSASFFHKAPIGCVKNNTNEEIFFNSIYRNDVYTRCKRSGR